MVAKKKTPAPKKAAAKKAAATKKKAPAKAKPAAKKKAPAKGKPAAKKKAATSRKPAAKKAPAKAKAKAKSKVKPKAKTASKAKPKSKAKAKVTSAVKSPKTASKKAAPKKAAQKKAPAKKAAAKKAPAKPEKAATKKVAVKKPAAAKTPAKKKAAPRKSSEGSFTPYVKKKDEEYMNEEQKDHFREILQGWKTQLMEEVDRTVNHMKDEAANYPDPSDRASQEEEFSLELKTRDRERKLIRKIENTLELIDADDYGYCDSCGIEIGVRRLEARPTATQCIDCKTIDELKERQLRG